MTDLGNLRPGTDSGQHQHSLGVKHLIVNGVPVIADGEPDTKAFPGLPVRRLCRPGPGRPGRNVPRSGWIAHEGNTAPSRGPHVPTPPGASAPDGPGGVLLGLFALLTPLLPGKLGFLVLGLLILTLGLLQNFAGFARGQADWIWAVAEGAVSFVLGLAVARQ